MRIFVSHSHLHLNHRSHVWLQVFGTTECSIFLKFPFSISHFYFSQLNLALFSVLFVFKSFAEKPKFPTQGLSKKTTHPVSFIIATIIDKRNLNNS